MPKKPNFKRLMAKHILAARKVVDSKLVKGKRYSKKLLKQGLDGLRTNTREWGDTMTLIFQNPETGRHFRRIWAEHVALEGRYIGAAFACHCASKDFGTCHGAKRAQKAVRALVRNGSKMVNFLARHFGKRRIWALLWAEHLQCVKDFIDLGKLVACKKAPKTQFNQGVKHCIKVSENFAKELRRSV